MTGGETHRAERGSVRAVARGTKRGGAGTKGRVGVNAQRRNAARLARSERPPEPASQKFSSTRSNSSGSVTGSSQAKFRHT
jgi:hypothetical protein